MRVLRAEDFPELQEKGRTFLRDGHERAWDPDDLQSFTPVRYAIPGRDGAPGRRSRHRSRRLRRRRRCRAVHPRFEGQGDLVPPEAWLRQDHRSSRDLRHASRLLETAALAFKDDIAALWDHRLDYLDWINLKREDLDTIGLLEPEWNDFDHLTPATKLLHNTKRRTQPWKTGLPVDFTFRERRGLMSLVMPIVRTVAPNYMRHPDRKQESYFYALLAEALDTGSVSREQVEREVWLGHVRSDSFELIDRYRGHLWPVQATPKAA